MKPPPTASSLPEVEIGEAPRVQPLPAVEGLPRLVKLPDLARALGTSSADLAELLRDDESPQVFRLSPNRTVVDLDWFRGWLQRRKVESAAEVERRVQLTRVVAGIRKQNPFGRRVCGAEEPSPK